MDQPPRKRGRTRVFLTKDVVERRRLAKKKINDSRRNLNGTLSCGSSQEVRGLESKCATGEVHHDGCSGVSPNANDGPGFDVVHNGAGDVPNHTPANLNPVENEVHHDVNESAGGSNGAQVWAAEFTGRHVGTGPKGYSICCSKGKVQLPMLRETPPELRELITSTGIHSNMFFNKSRVYNNIFAFCSFGGNVDHSVNNGKGPFVFRVSGRTYHSLGSLVPPDGLTPKFAQLYMYDGQDAVGHRLNFSAMMGEVDPAIVSMLQEMFHRDNALVGIFKQLRDRFTDGDPEHVRLRLLERRTTDDLFITFTCNPKWDEIQATVRSSGSHDASVRPDLVARVFKMKLDAMMDDFTKKHVLGRVRAVVYTIEFQKRGLPHAHIVVWLEGGIQKQPWSLTKYTWIIGMVFLIIVVRVDYSGDVVEAVVKEIYGDLQNRHGDIEYLRSRAILTPLNEHVENVNMSVLHNLPGEFKAYKSCDSICKGSSTGEADEILYLPEYLNSLKFNGMPNHEVQVKVGAPIMLLRNLNPKKGLCNGTRLIVTRCYPFLIEALILTGNKIGDTTYIPRITMCPADKTFPFVLKRKQFPVVVCYAMTVNKSQGQTVRNVGLYLPEPVFGHGQMYVAVSRVTSPNGLKIVYVHEDESTTGYTKNIVYREIFDNLV
ncbi:hypothetical protein POM88_013805 [Heracleum sosnowskyi]|uniref:DNA helicase n=1 Tax=Heracleum sosnowskyi TaxID=360622 RepID=A0AAD8IZ84_9APIA|nr:hypothetical protein POM88_013805 [Heracleum sosnowskyi]